ncbi:hypothetical protein HU200_044571 [Digitaria exilis]|uniref:Uncharacterized protein n=1 Tax=Digitaria exilis TaxID=1010633 RepID=A0A835ECN5_9POAL|nr:hypothetical protein HU200_044571 [Digitaria exilis]
MRRRRIFGFCVLWGGKEREMGEGRDSMCQRECMPPPFGLVFLCAPRREIGLSRDRSVTAAAECGRSTLARNSFLVLEKGGGEQRPESCRRRCSDAAAAYVQVRSLSRGDKAKIRVFFANIIFFKVNRGNNSRFEKIAEIIPSRPLKGRLQACRPLKARLASWRRRGT